MVLNNLPWIHCTVAYGWLCPGRGISEGSGPCMHRQGASCDSLAMLEALGVEDGGDGQMV